RPPVERPGPPGMGGLRLLDRLQKVFCQIRGKPITETSGRAAIFLLGYDKTGAHTKTARSREVRLRMTWFPLGPSFNFLPRNPNYLRLSSQNLLGAQGTVTAIAVHPTAAGHWLVVDRPDNGGSGLWLTTNAGDSWSPVLDAVLASS